MGIPTSLRAGDTWSWSESISDYPASAGWTLAYSLLPVGGSGSKITVTASAAGADYAVAVPAATTAGYAAGAYTYSARVSKAGEVHTIENLTGTLTLLPDLGAATVYDARSTASKALAKIDAWISGDKSIEVAAYTIGDRQIQHHDIAKLLQLRNALRAEVASEQAAAKLAAGGADPRNLYVRFGPG
jgi:hypothetical protein